MVKLQEKQNLIYWFQVIVYSGYQFSEYRRIIQNYFKMLHHIQKDACQPKDSHHRSLSKLMPTLMAQQTLSVMYSLFLV